MIKLDKRLVLTWHLDNKKKVMVGHKKKKSTFKQEKCNDVRNTLYVENPKKVIKNNGLSNNVIFLLCLDCIMCENRLISYNKDLPISYQLSTLFSQSPLRFSGSCPPNIAICSFYNLRNTAEYKDMCQYIISLLWTFA